MKFTCRYGAPLLPVFLCWLVLSAVAFAATTFNVSAPSTATAGTPFSITVTASDTTYQGTVHFDGGDPTATLPADYTFTAADAGVHTFANGVSLPTAGLRVITATDTGNPSITGASSVITVSASIAAPSRSATYMDTTQADFQAGTSLSVNLTTSPGDAIPLSATPDQSNSTVGTSGVGITTTTWGGQTFTPSVTGPLVKADIHLFASGVTGTTPDLTLSVRATSGGLPTGPDLATATIPGFNSGADVVYTGVFTTPATLTAGTQYALLIHPVANPSPGIYALTRSGTSTSGSDVYSGGTRVAGPTSVTVWSIPLTGGVSTDAGFTTYMQGANADGTLISDVKDSNPGTLSTTWTTLSWNAAVPGGATVRFQVAASNSASGPYNFVGPDGTSSTYYTTSGGDLSQFNGNRYLVYEAFLNGPTASPPILHDVTVAATAASPTTPTIATTQQPASAPSGSSIAAKATVSGGNSPTGTVTFQLYNNSAGTGTPLFTDTETLSGGTATSTSYFATTAGTFYWVATYSGDANNNAVTSGTAAAPVTIVAPPTISQSFTPNSISVGGTSALTFTVTNPNTAASLTGISFTETLPSGMVVATPNGLTGGAGSGIITATAGSGSISVTGGTLAASASFTFSVNVTATAARTFVATTSAINSTNGGTGFTASATLTVVAAPTITVTPVPPTTTVGSTIAASTVLAGGFSPTGTSTFLLFNNPNGAGAPLYTATVTVNGNGTYTTPAGFTTNAAGTFYWMATYSGDPNNIAVTSGTAAAPVTVFPLPTAFTVGGGGSYTAGGGGVHVNLSGSQTGVNYQLYLNGSATGSPVAGTGAPLDFGAQTAAGTYTVVATDATTLATNTMTGQATVIVFVVITGHDYTVTNSTSAGSLTTSTTGLAISGTTVTLTGTDSQGTAVNITTTTDSSGAFSFANLLPSNASGYTLTETPPAGFAHLGQTSNTFGAVTNIGSVVSKLVVTASNSPSIANFFEIASVSVSGADYLMPFGTTAGSLTTSSTGTGLTGVSFTLTGTDRFGNLVSQVTTSAVNGGYSFSGLNPSNAAGYTVTAAPPSGYTHLGQTSTLAGSITNTPPGTPAVISNIVLTADGASCTGNFFETPTPGSITVTSGNNQSATVNTAFANPLAVTVLDTFNNPISGATVTFTAPASGTSGTFSNSSNAITLTTNASGVASASAFIANTSAGSYNVTAAVGSLTANFSLINTPGAATNFAVSTPLAATAGSAFNFMVFAKDQFGNTATSYAGIVQFVSSDGSATLPANSQLINGSGTFSATLGTAGNQTISAVDTVNSILRGTSNPIVVSSAAATHFSVNAPSTVTQGTPFTLTVTALDQFNNTATSYHGTVHFTTSDGGPGVVLPANYPFVAGDAGVHTFTATLVTGGNQTITATDTSTSITGTSNSIDVFTINPTAVQVGTTATVDPQTGLFNLAVNVTNTTAAAINGFRLHVDYSAYVKAYPSLKLFNATSLASYPDVYVDYPYPVAVNATVVVNLEFYTSTRTFPNPFKPVLTVTTLSASETAQSNPPTQSVPVAHILKLANGNVLLEYPSTPGAWYRITYSNDLTNWFDSPVPIHASTTQTQWIDSGAPLTSSPPSTVPSRFYYVRKIAAP